MYKSLEQQTKERVLGMFKDGASVQEISKALNLQLSYVRSITGSDTKGMSVDEFMKIQALPYRQMAERDRELLKQAMTAPYQGVQSRSPFQFYGLDFSDLEDRSVAVMLAEKAQPTPSERLAEARATADAKVREKAATEALLNMLLSAAGECNCPSCMSKKQAQASEQKEETLPESRADIINQIKERSTEDLTFISMVISRELNKRYNDPIKQGKPAPDSSIS